jgi:hypothetical protein
MTAVFYQDLTACARLGFKGSTAGQALTERGAILPAEVYACVIQQDGGLLTRLSQNEYLWLHPDASGTSGDEMPDTSACYSIHWQSSHGWFAMGGEGVLARLAEICSASAAELAAHNCLPVMLGAIPAWLIFWNLGDGVSHHLLVPRPHARAIWNWMTAVGD